MELLPIQENPEANAALLADPSQQMVVSMTIDFYKKVGFVPPWIGYLAKQEGVIVGSAGFKGPPVNGTVEIAYGAGEAYQNQGVGTNMCRKLVELSLQTDPFIKITAKTLPERNFSVRILEKNNFVFTGISNDPEDGVVWEWEFQGNL